MGTTRSCEAQESATSGTHNDPVCVMSVPATWDIAIPTDNKAAR